jgi:hypothetical protein
MLSSALEPWCSIYFGLKFYRHLVKKMLLFLLFPAACIGNVQQKRRGAANILFFLIIHQFIGAANHSPTMYWRRKHKQICEIVLNVSFCSPNGANGKVLPIYWCCNVSSTKLLVDGASMHLAPKYWWNYAYCSNSIGATIL